MRQGKGVAGIPNTFKVAERCEAAAGPSGHLDAQIFILIEPDAQHIIGAKPGRFPQEPIYGPRSSFWEWATDESIEPPVLPCPKYTASLDAAMTLVPEGAKVTTQSFGGPGPMALVEPNERFCSAATLPLALCAAALRARAA